MEGKKMQEELDYGITEESVWGIRRAAMEFHRRITEGVSGNINVVDIEEPWSGAAGDFRVLALIKMIYASFDIIEAVSKMEINGKPVVRERVKQRYSSMIKSSSRLRSMMPTRNDSFVYAYADVDERLGEQVRDMAWGMVKVAANNSNCYTSRELTVSNAAYTCDVAAAIVKGAALAQIDKDDAERCNINNPMTPAIRDYYNSILAIRNEICSQYKISINNDEVDKIEKQMENSIRWRINSLTDEVEKLMRNLDWTDYRIKADMSHNVFCRLLPLLRLMDRGMSSVVIKMLVLARQEGIREGIEYSSKTNKKTKKK